MPEGHAAVWRTRDAGSSWQPLDRGLPQRDAHVGVLREAMAVDSEDAPGLYFGTSTGRCFERRRRRHMDAVADYLPAISLVEVASDRLMADVRLPSTLEPLFPGCRDRSMCRRPPSATPSTTSSASGRD